MADFVALYMALGFTEEQARRYVEAGQGVRVTVSKDSTLVEWIPPILSLDAKVETPDGP